MVVGGDRSLSIHVCFVSFCLGLFCCSNDTNPIRKPWNCRFVAWKYPTKIHFSKTIQSRKKSNVVNEFKLFVGCVCVVHQFWMIVVFFFICSLRVLCQVSRCVSSLRLNRANDTIDIFFWVSVGFAWNDRWWKWIDLLAFNLRIIIIIIIWKREKIGPFNTWKIRARTTPLRVSAGTELISLSVSLWILMCACVYACLCVYKTFYRKCRLRNAMQLTMPTALICHRQIDRWNFISDLFHLLRDPVWILHFVVVWQCRGKNHYSFTLLLRCCCCCYCCCL